MKNKTISTKLVNVLIIFFSSILAIWAANKICQYYFEFRDSKSECIEYDAQNFINSRGYSLTNNRYKKNQEVRHCDKEFDYTYHIDSNGLRLGGKSPKDILAVGDSFTFGFGVQDTETYPSRLNAFNAGMWGNTFNVQYRSLAENVKLLNPKDVIWGIYPPHLISMTSDQWNKKSPGDHYFELTNEQKKIFNSLNLPKINEYPLIKLIMNSFGYKGVRFELDWLVIEKNPYHSKERLIYNKCANVTAYTNNAIKNSELSTELRKAYSELEIYIKKSKDIERKSGVKIYFLLIPSKWYLANRYGHAEINTYEGECIDLEYPNSKIKQFVINAGFPTDRIIDLSQSEKFQDKNWLPLYFSVDAHWNTHGNAVVSSIVENHLKLYKR